MVLSAQGSRAPGPNPKEPEDSEELARFRAEWRAELARRKAAEQSEQKGKQPEETQGQAEAKLSTRNANHRPPIRALTTGAHVPGGSAQKQQVLPLHPAIQDGKLASALGKSSTLSAALQVYKQAVQHEQRQDLDTALILYRQAFRLDPHVDRAYHREELLQAKLQEYKEKATVHLPPSEAAEVKQLVSGLQQLALKTTTDDRQRALTGSLAKITAGFPSDIQFEPEDEKQPVHLNILPPEMLFAILRNLDVTSLERFATVSRKARLLTLDPVYWSDLVTKTYKPPQLQNIEDLLPVIEKYNSDFRRVYIEHPRIRMDGVYIATCHYVRAGISEDAWMSRSHLITYHRYLRFYPNGQVLSLLANEQLSPQDVIPMLKPTLRMKGFFIGNWYLEGTTLNIVNLLDASGRYALPDWDLLDAEPFISRNYRTPPAPSIPDSGQPGVSTNSTFAAMGSSAPNAATTASQASRYIFDMTLEVRSKPLGRWNRLEIRSYDSINLETGDVSPFPLKNERPFWFSKVRSYSH